MTREEWKEKEAQWEKELDEAYKKLEEWKKENNNVSLIPIWSTDKELCEMFDSGKFNSIIIGYVGYLAKALRIDEEEAKYTMRDILYCMYSDKCKHCEKDECVECGGDDESWTIDAKTAWENSKPFDKNNMW